MDVRQPLTHNKQEQQYARLDQNQQKQPATIRFPQNTIDFHKKISILIFFFLQPLLYYSFSILRFLISIQWRTCVTLSTRISRMIWTFTGIIDILTLQLILVGMKILRMISIRFLCMNPTILSFVHHYISLRVKQLVHLHFTPGIRRFLRCLFHYFQITGKYLDVKQSPWLIELVALYESKRFRQFDFRWAFWSTLLWSQYLEWRVFSNFDTSSY